MTRRISATGKHIRHRVWRCRVPSMLILTLCGLGCGNGDATKDLARHGLALNHSRNTAFVIQTSDDEERQFGDGNLIAALPALQQLPNVKRLQLTGTSVTDRSLVQLKNVSNIEEIEVIDTAVTRDGLLGLKGMPNLHFVLVDGDRLSEADVRAVQDGLPGVQVLVKKQLGPLYPVTTRPFKYERVPPF